MKSYKKEILRSWWNDNLDFLPLGSKYRGLWQKRTVRRLIKEIDIRKLDILIAEKIFDGRVEVLEFPDDNLDHEVPELALNIKNYDEQYHETWYEIIKLPHYSVDLHDTWEIINFLIEKNIRLEILEDLTTTDPVWNCQFCEYDSMEAETPAKAICLAALRVMGVKYND